MANKSPRAPSVPSTGTRVILPPLSPANRTGTSAISSNPDRLLDAFDVFVASRRGNGSDEQQPDPIDFLNQHFSSEAQIVAQLSNIREAISDRMDRLDDKISSALQRQSESAELTQQHVQDAKVSVVNLEKRIRLVQEKASQSEKTVREITKDMKRLDCAKRHLQRTITTLKRLHMLVHAVEGLRQACLLQPYPDYKSASHLVDATRLLLKHFDTYTQKVEPMRLLATKVDDLQAELKFSLVRAFRIVNFGPEKTKQMEKKGKKMSLVRPEDDILVDVGSETSDDIIEENQDLDEDPKPKRPPPPPMSPDSMAGGVLLIDAIGKEARIEFMTGFVQDQLIEYSKIYKPVKEKPIEKPRVSSFMAQPEAPKDDAKQEYALEFIEKRFLWFSKLLTGIQQMYPGVFPTYWNLEYHLAKNFLRRTKSHLLALLSGPNKDPDANNATILLKALQKTIIFEKDVCSALQREYGVVFLDGPKKDTAGNSAANVNSKVPPSIKGSTVAIGEDSSANEIEEDGRAPTENVAVEPLLGLASSAFDKHMRPYIALEEQSMDEQLVSSLEDRTVDTRGNHPVFTTSTKLFVYIKGSITRCTNLTKGNTFFLLYNAFQDSLRKYAQVLSSKLPPPLPAKTVGPLNMPPVPFAKNPLQQTEAPPAQAATYKVPVGEEVTICHVIGTCEYCAETVEALEDLIRDTIDDEFKDKIDMMAQQEAFHEITAKAIRVLVSGLENRLDEPFKMMSSINWAMFAEVGEESDYVRYMHKEIQPYVSSSRTLIPKSYFQSFCDKFALGFTSMYYDSVIRLKTISEQGSQQLLLDVYNLKTLILKLPVLEVSTASTPTARKAVATGSTIAPAMYTKMVQKQFKNIELLLKMAGTPINLLIDVFKDQWPGGTALDLQQVMSLKGLKRNEQAAMLEKFGLDPKMARKGATVNITSATIVSERFQAVQESASRVDMSQMRQKVNDFRNSFRPV
ncbi:Vps53 vacuolar sorting complex protein [Nitzschia inconspicua]|uniref:Vps53 vacuolar sorting complex protein n=1 Tax=Nitzschia inconspicua TaxID=303405 RepID=A0A9K3LF26_9STRA|nr:Vps53 vacuolar sorting complex protein [Nitzschia inconspicua]